MIDKSVVCGSFSKAVAQYDALALFQRHLNEKMLCLLPEKMPVGFSPETILDAGCGTGFGTQCLKNYWPDKEMAGCDISPEMVDAMHKKGLKAVVGDMANLPFNDRQFNLVWSCLALQWCPAKNVFQEFFRVLKDDGMLFFSTLAPGSLKEIKAAFAGFDHADHTLAFLPLSEIQVFLAQAGFREISLQQNTQQMFYPDIKSAIASVRDIGAGSVSNRRNSLFGKDAWRKVQERYETFRGNDGLPVSYEVILGSAIR